MYISQNLVRRYMDISIIMIGSNFYNQLDQSMESIANQSDVDDIDYELILVNAGTSDRGQTDSKIADWKRKIINFKPFDFLAIKHPGGLELGDYADLARSRATGTVAIYLPPFDIMAKNRVSTIFNLFNKIYNIGNHVIVSDYVKNNLVIDVSNKTRFVAIPGLCIAHNLPCGLDEPYEIHYNPIIAGTYNKIKGR